MTPDSEFFTNNLVLFIALGIILALIVRMEIKRAMRGFKNISPAEAVQLINKEDAIMLDVRESNELTQGSIRGAKHLALSVLKQRVEELKAHTEQPIIAYCKAGTRSSAACEILKKNNFTNVMSLKGGIEGWKTANLPVVKS
ncbi:MAG: rhodanese-like domain-containing protein [Gammaproteobacteria bacterium]|nr:rhodanese-like domain-containing protein [Gammaproteobacteria bacterium]